MGLFRNLFGARRRSTMTWAELEKYFTQAGGSAAGALNQSEIWRNSIWVQLCLLRTAEAIAQLPFEVWRTKPDGESERVTKHPALDFVARPNPDRPQVSSFLLWAESILLRQYFGEAFWILERGGARGDVKKAVIWPGSAFTEITNRSTGELRGWLVRFEQQKFTVLPEDVAHFPRLDPIAYNPLRPGRGVSQLAALGLAASSDIQASRFNLGFFKRGAVSSSILTTDDDAIGESEASTLLEKIKAKLQERPHEPIFVPGKWAYHQNQFTQKDSDFILGRKLNREEIVAGLGVPPAIVGIPDTANYATLNAQVKVWWQTVLMPLAQSISSVFDGVILRDPALSSRFSTDGIAELQDSLTDRMANADKLWAKGVPWNVIDRMLDIGTGDIEGGDIGFISFGVIPVKDAIALEDPEPEPVPPVEPPPDPDDEEEELEDDEDPDDDEKNRMAAQIMGVPPATLPTRAGVPADVLKAILDLIEGDDDRLKGISGSFFQKGYKVGIDQMAKLLDLDVSFGVKDARAKVFLESKLIRITNVNKTVKELVRKQILLGISKGETVAEVAKRVKAKYSAFETSRARLIARTEISQSVNGGRFGLLQEEGVEKHEWLDSADERVRETHQQEDGHVVEVGQTFPITGVKFPGDPDGPRDEVINCRCITLAADEASRMIRGVESRDAYWRAAVQGYRKIENGYRSALKKYFFEQRSAVLAALAKAE